MKNKKEELQKQLDEIKKQEEKELVDKHYPEFKKFEGVSLTANHMVQVGDPDTGKTHGKSG